MDSGFLGPQFAAMIVIGLVVGAMLLVFVGGAVLRLSVRWVGGFAPGYWRSCLAVLVASIASFALQMGLGFVVMRVLIGSDGMLPGGPLSYLLAAAGTAISAFVTAAAVHLLLRRQDGSALSITRSLGAAMLAIVLGIALYVACAIALILVVGGVPGLAH
jgi:hypothetical protein